MGIGDWGLGIGDWGLGPIPNPQSPIPNPQSPIPNLQIKFSLKNILNNNIININIKNKNIIYYLFIISPSFSFNEFMTKEHSSN